MVNSSALFINKFKFLAPVFSYFNRNKLLSIKTKQSLSLSYKSTIKLNDGMSLLYRPHYLFMCSFWNSSVDFILFITIWLWFHCVIAGFLLYEKKPLITNDIDSKGCFLCNCLVYVYICEVLIHNVKGKNSLILDVSSRYFASFAGI